MKKQKAFTVIELLVVLAIVGLIASMVLVNLRDSKDKAEIAKILQYSGSVKNALGAEIVGEWRFEESGGGVIDTSGSGNDGTINGADRVSSIPELGEALYFDGTNDYVRTDDVSSSLNLSGESVTITAWIKFNSIQSGYRCMYNYHPAGNGWYTLYKSDAHTLHMRIGNQFLNGVEIFTDDDWYFVVGTWDNDAGRIVLYINGLEDNRGNRTPAWGGSSDAFAFIGGHTSERINATIDEVRIYGETLDSAQIRKLYAQGLVKHLTDNNWR